ncbi:MAG: ABC transporter substrate-binding protein [bacterium]|nr:ABC transporter substrate-binding protein [bacterium]
MTRGRLLTACTAFALSLRSSLPASAAERSILRLAGFAHSSVLDPYTTQTPAVSDMAWLYADGLVGVGRHGPVGLLAEQVPTTRNGGISPDGLAVTYTLRRGVRWHDGLAFTAGDVVAAFQRVQDSGWRGNRPYSLVRSVEALSPHRVRVSLERPDPLFPFGFFSAYGEPNLPLVRAGRSPVGTGPFAIRGFSNSTGAYTLQSWSSSPRGPSSVAEIRYTFVPDQNTEAVGFAAGEYDIALIVPHAFVESRHLRFARYTGGALMLFANVSGVLSDARLRELTFSAINREALRRKALGDWGLPANTIVAPELSGALRVPEIRPDPERVRQRLQSLYPKSVQLTFAGLPGLGDNIGLLLQAQLRSAGIDLEVKTFSPQEYFAPNGPLHGGHFDLALDGASYNRDPGLADSFSCAAIDQGENFSRFCSPQLDRALASNDFELASRILWKNAVTMPLAQLVNCIGLGPRVKNFHVQNYVPITYFCNEWSLH